MCKIWSKSTYAYSRYWAETIFWRHSRAINVYWIDENWCLTIPSKMSSIWMHTQNLVKIHCFILKIFSGNEILKSFKGHNSAMNWQKWMLNNQLEVININAYAKSGQNPSKFFQDIERKRKCYGWTDGQPQNSIPPILCIKNTFEQRPSV